MPSPLVFRGARGPERAPAPGLFRGPELSCSQLAREASARYPGRKIWKRRHLLRIAGGRRGRGGAGGASFRPSPGNALPGSAGRRHMWPELGKAGAGHGERVPKAEGIAQEKREERHENGGNLSLKPEGNWH